MGFLRDENHKQNMEIASLKETVLLQKKTTIIKMLSANGLNPRRRIRPVRLLPPNILYDKTKNDTGQKNRNTI